MIIAPRPTPLPQERFPDKTTPTVHTVGIFYLWRALQDWLTPPLQNPPLLKLRWTGVLPPFCRGSNCLIRRFKSWNPHRIKNTHGSHRGYSLFLARPAGLADTALAKSTFVKTTVDRRASAFLPRVELLNSQVQILGLAQNKKHPRFTPWVFFISGAPCRIRTCDLRIRNPMLYPAGLRAHVRYSILSFRKFQVLHI